MAIDTDSYKSALTKLETNLQEKLYELFDKGKYQAIDSLAKIISNKFPSIEGKIESFIESNLINTLMFNVKSLLTDIEGRVDTAKKHASMQLEKKGEKRASSSFSVLLNEIHRNYQGTEISSAVKSFLDELPHFLLTHGISENLNTTNYEEKASDLKRELEKLFQTHINIYTEKVRKAIKEEISKLIDSIVFSETLGFSSELSQDDTTNLKFIVTFTDYRVVGDKFINSKTSEEYPFKKVGERVFESLDGKISFSYKDKEWNFTEGDTCITVTNSYIAVGTRENRNEIQINYGIDEVIFIYHNKSVTDPTVISHICEELKNKYPRLYETQLEKNADFKATEAKAIEDKKSQNKFYVDESGKVRINSNNKETLENHLASLGYKVYEDNDNIVLKDSNGEILNTTINGNTINLSNGTKIALDVYTYPKMSAAEGPNVHFSNPESGVSVHFSEDYSKVSVFVDNNVYVVGIEDSTLKVRGFENNRSIKDFNHITEVIGLSAKEVLKKVLKTYKHKQEHSLPPILFDEETDVVSAELIAELEGKLNKSEEHTILPDVPIAKEVSVDLGSTYQELIAEIELDDIQENKLGNNETEYLTEEQIDDRLFELSQDSKVQEYLELLRRREELSQVSSQGLGKTF